MLGMRMFFIYAISFMMYVDYSMGLLRFTFSDFLKPGSVCSLTVKSILIIIIFSAKMPSDKERSD
jgi:hypothetical protein